MWETLKKRYVTSAHLTNIAIREYPKSLVEEYLQRWKIAKKLEPDGNKYASKEFE